MSGSEMYICFGRYCSLDLCRYKSLPLLLFFFIGGVGLSPQVLLKSLLGAPLILASCLSRVFKILRVGIQRNRDLKLSFKGYDI
jgi:hypothetical protein